MSEKLFSFLLRLYPSYFRHAYGHEALQLFRDRARNETGLYGALRLWFDLFTDAVVSLPREYLHARPVEGPSRQHLVGGPSFVLLASDPLGAHALLSGTVASLIFLGVVSLALTHLGTQVRVATSTIGRSPLPSSFSSEQSPPPSTSEPYQSPARAGTALLNAAERQRIVTAAAHNLRDFYVDKDMAQTLSDSLLSHLRNGDDDAATDATAFAQLLTAQMQQASSDPHLELIYSPDILPPQPSQQAGEVGPAYRAAMLQQNCTFEKVEMLPHSIAYFKLNSFPDVSACRPQAAAVMASFNRAQVLIFDLRDNRGGMPEMVTLLASYLFDHPEYIFNPRDNVTRNSWTQPPSPASNLAHTPVYVLTSSRTISAAEQFTYDLKMLKRATIVGETTAGASHSAVFHRLDDHFGMGIPETMPVNPFSDRDWSNIGVAPDVMVDAADALTAAIKLARSHPSPQ